VTEPLALLVYERVLPGGQLVNRLQDLGYRVLTVSDPATLVEHAEKEKPLLLIADVESRSDRVCEAIKQLKQHGPTAHIPVIAVASAGSDREDAARSAGAELVVTDTAVRLHLTQLLDQALHVE
jgi:CheY-like chemotaxis protein